MKAVSVALLVLLLSWAGLEIARDAVATLLSASNPDRALAWSTNLQSVLDGAAAQQLSKDDADLDEVQTLLTKSLRLHPLDSTALYLLSESARRLGNENTANALLELAGRRSWRQVQVQMQLAGQDIDRREFDRSLLHIDAALRVSPERWNNYIGILAAFVLDPDALGALQRFLVQAPPWREWFLQQLSLKLVARKPLDSLFSYLSKSSAPPTYNERISYVDRLIRDKLYAEAHRQWLEGLSVQLRPQDRYLYNSDFAQKLDRSPFNWSIVAEHGADIRVEPGKSQKPGALRAQFSGSRVRASVRHLMTLSPGRYEFSGEVRADDLRTSRGVRWEIYCAEAENDRLAVTGLTTESTDWKAFSVEFEVPPQLCSAQWLKMGIPARIPSENEIEGQILYRSLFIQPIAPRFGFQAFSR